jgi:hypothetical protein
VKLDLLSEYGVDVYDAELMRSRPWAWLRDLIIGLLSTPPRRLLVPVDENRSELRPIWTTRIQLYAYEEG